MEWLCEVLKLERKSMPHRSSYERILEQVVSWKAMEQLVSRVLSGKRYPLPRLVPTEDLLYAQVVKVRENGA